MELVSSYIPRIADGQLDRALRRAGAVLVEGVRACGKTETALQRANSVVHLDRDPSAIALLAVDPGLVLDGAVPRLLDEWQMTPDLWNLVRGEVDRRQLPGQFILTGSTAPAADRTRHTGAGRFARLRMTTLTLFESGHSTGEVSFEALVSGESGRATDPGFTYADLTERMVRGGWPGMRGLDAGEISENLFDYLQTIAMIDLRASDGSERDPLRVGRLLRALARSVGTEVSITTLAKDETSLSRDSVRDYLSALERIFVVENQPAWSTHLRSSATLRKEPKRHFADPSLAAAALHTTPISLAHNPAYAGQLFESLVFHDLSVFASPLRASVSHARDSQGNEVDAIVTSADGGWSGFEVKLGNSPAVVDQAAQSLTRFAKNVEQEPRSLTVLTSQGASYRRGDGVNVVSIGTLGP